MSLDEQDSTSGPHQVQKVDGPIAGPPVASLREGLVEESVVDPQTGTITKRGEYRAEVHMGPIPDPESLARYAAIDPSLPNRIMTMAEKTMVHRQSEESKTREAITAENNKALQQGDRGQHYALFVVIAVLLVAWDSMTRGHLKTAVAIATIDMASLVGLFLYPRLKSKRRGRKVSLANRDAEDP